MTKEFTREQRLEWLKTLPGNPASSAMILENPQGEVLLVKAGYRHYWSLPGGVVDPGESPKDAAIREVKEEVGLAISPESVEFVGTVYRTSPIIDTYQFIFTAKVTRAMSESIVLQESEIEDYLFVAKDHVKKSDLPYAPVVTKWADGKLSAYGEEIVDYLAE